MVREEPEAPHPRPPAARMSSSTPGRPALDVATGQHVRYRPDARGRHGADTKKLAEIDAVIEHAQAMKRRLVDATACRCARAQDCPHIARRLAALARGAP